MFRAITYLLISDPDAIQPRFVGEVVELAERVVTASGDPADLAPAAGQPPAWLQLQHT